MWGRNSDLLSSSKSLYLGLASAFKVVDLVECFGNVVAADDEAVIAKDHRFVAFHVL